MKRIRSLVLGAMLATTVIVPATSPAATTSAECYAVMIPGQPGSICEKTFGAPSASAAISLHAAVHANLPAAGSLTIQWLGYQNQLLVTWDCARGGVIQPDKAATDLSCERTNHITPIVPYGTQRLRVTATGALCLDTTGAPAACAAHGKISFTS